MSVVATCEDGDDVPLVTKGALGYWWPWVALWISPEERRKELAIGKLHAKHHRMTAERPCA